MDVSSHKNTPFKYNIGKNFQIWWHFFYQSGIETERFQRTYNKTLQEGLENPGSRSHPISMQQVMWKVPCLTTISMYVCNGSLACRNCRSPVPQPPGPLQVKYGSARSYIFATACVFRMECFIYNGMYTKVCYEKNMTTHLGLHTVEELYWNPYIQIPSKIISCFSHLGPTQVKCRLLISSNFYAMNIWHFLEMMEFNLWHFFKMSEIHCIKNARS